MSTQAGTPREEDMSDSSATTSITGTPGSPGRASGPARVVHSPDDFARVLPGDVLVCRFTEPAWTALFGVVAAVVTETGGVLSHAAIVAREYGIPAVLAVPGAMTALRDGDTVTVDGGAGRVTAA
jgi:pyruvate,water dikinase